MVKAKTLAGILPGFLLFTGLSFFIDTGAYAQQVLSREQCVLLYRAMDDWVAFEHVADAQSVRVKDYPFLRSDRFVVSFRDEQPSQDLLRRLVSYMAYLDRTAREAEYRNLSNGAQHEIVQSSGIENADAATFSRCSDIFLDNFSLINSQDFLESLPAKTIYKTLHRVLGIYPLTSIFLAQGVKKLHAETKADFEKPLSELQLNGALARYAYGGKRANDPIDFFLDLTPEQLKSLFETHAPVFEVETAGYADRIGTPYLQGRNVFVNAGFPVVYQLLSYTRKDGRILLQLNYVIWFDARPKTSVFDIYGGRLDGLNWRVTLDENFNPLVYDSMHNCGCYHQVYSVEGAELTVDKTQREPLLVVQEVKRAWLDKTLIVRMSANKHFVQRVYPYERQPSEQTYVMRDYNELRSLPTPTGFKSMFAEDGIVHSSERLENWILWPAGVPAPGAMRQWGNHAIAFVGKRYFVALDFWEK